MKRETMLCQFDADPCHPWTNKMGFLVGAADACCGAIVRVAAALATKTIAVMPIRRIIDPRIMLDLLARLALSDEQGDRSNSRATASRLETFVIEIFAAGRVR
ncbi:hypothetical protein [Nocardia niwae]|uniref:Uncharacterized protein n=1 Tax=Nocardia niwae TaxID=626084 RepID=A0ABV2XHY9_9NOCA|nr:hypothetical protein [Nocardia niwae]